MANTLTKNQLLSALPEQECRSLLPLLDEVQLLHGQTLCMQGDAVEFVYFPLDAVISLMSNMSDGKSVELTMVGNEGAVGATALLGGHATWYECVGQISGHALRGRLGALDERFSGDGVLPSLLMRYLHMLYAHISQVAACNRLHTAEQRFCTWLLMMHDRIEGSELALTQEAIAHTLGFRRPTINDISILLQQKNVLQYSRGRIRILDRAGLEASACKCYWIMKTEQSLLLHA